MREIYSKIEHHGDFDRLVVINRASLVERLKILLTGVVSFVVRYPNNAERKPAA